MSWPRLCPARLMDPHFGTGMSPDDFMFPFYTYPGINYYRPWKWCTQNSFKDCGSTVIENKDNFKITLDVQHFRPEEINVKATDTEVIIEGKHEERKDDHGFISRQFKRRYYLPSNCPSENVFSTLSSDGILTVVANKTNKLESKEKIVPIKMSGATVKTEQVSKKTANDTTLKVSSDMKKESGDNTVNKNTQIMLREEHSRLLKPELLKNAVPCNTEKIIAEAKKEVDEILKKSEAIADEAACSSGKQQTSQQAVASTAMAESSDKSGAMSSSNTKTMSSEILESKMLSTSYKSSTTSKISSVKASGEKTSDVVSEIISAELKEAAENI